MADHTNGVLATSLSPDWRWIAATVPPGAHSLGGKLFYVVLESNRTTNQDRLITLTPP